MSTAVTEDSHVALHRTSTPSRPALARRRTLDGAESCGVSDDGIYRYDLAPTPAHLGRFRRSGQASGQASGQTWWSVTVTGPGVCTDTLHGFDDRDAALAWVRVHAGLSDLSQFRRVRSALAMRRWAELVDTPDPLPGEGALRVHAA